MGFGPAQGGSGGSSDPALGGDLSGTASNATVAKVVNVTAQAVGTTSSPQFAAVLVGGTDTGIGRSAAGVIKPTDGATGRGYLGAKAAVFAYRTTDQSLTSATEATVVCDTEEQDPGNCYNNTTGVYTAPVAGTYIFRCSAQFYNNTFTGGAHYIRVNGGTYWASEAIEASDKNRQIVAIIPLAASDTVEWRVVETGANVKVYGTADRRYCHFSAALLPGQ